MAGGADVRSIQVLRDWLAALAGYKSDASECLSGVQMELRRGITWLEEQHTLWQRAVRQCQDDLHQAKAELSQRKIPNWDGKMPDTTIQERAVRRAKDRLEHAEEQVVRCRTWLVNLPKLVDELYTGPAHRLQTFLDGDLTHGMARLGRQIESLERYAGERQDFGVVTTDVAPPPASNPGGGS